MKAKINMKLKVIMIVKMQIFMIAKISMKSKIIMKIKIKIQMLIKLMKAKINMK